MGCPFSFIFCCTISVYHAVCGNEKPVPVWVRPKIVGLLPARTDANIEVWIDHPNTLADVLKDLLFCDRSLPPPALIFGLRLELVIELRLHRSKYHVETLSNDMVMRDYFGDVVPIDQDFLFVRKIG